MSETTFLVGRKTVNESRRRLINNGMESTKSK